MTSTLVNIYVRSFTKNGLGIICNVYQFVFNENRLRMENLFYMKNNDLESRLSHFDITTQRAICKLKGLPPLNIKVTLKSKI